ncbi:heparinase II/III family protein [Akkermansiaceae bacterium]|nr:heparinase II/III family protein [Akkermansiaceae bacterium]
MNLKAKFALVGRYGRTLRHLRLSQTFGQVRFRLQKLWSNPARILKNVPNFLEVSDQGRPIDIPSPCPQIDVNKFAKGIFTFVNQTANLGRPVDWAASGMPRLWCYNLHYFDWLWSFLPEADEDWQNARELIQDWIAHHPPSKTSAGWEPYPTSLRLINWAILVGSRHRKKLLEDSEFRETFLKSIAQQVRWLERNLETHIQANHLLENLAALTCVAFVFKGTACVAIQDRIAPILSRELQEQVLDDGLHYERSPMYHLRVLWLVEMLTQLGNFETKRLGLMRDALAHLRHPDGEIALLNDAAIGVYQDSWKDESNIGAWALPSAGYYGFRNSRGDYFIADAGAIGPDHQPGHAHADFLSFELSLAGHRVVTDTGVGTYETGTQRSHDRSTAAHSTVEVAGENSVEVWGAFRVGRRTSPKVLGWEPREDGCLLEAEHAGYSHLPSRAVHRRIFEWKIGQLEIKDQILINESVAVVGRIHLDPEVEARLDGQTISCCVAGISFIIEVEGPGELTLEKGSAFACFGQERTRQVVVVRATATAPSLSWGWRIRRL